VLAVLTYITLKPEVVDLSDLSPEERAHFAATATAYRAGETWAAFTNARVNGLENPLIRATGGRVTRAVWEHPLYRALYDLGDRLGIAQGYVAPDPDSDMSTDPFDDSWLSTGEAARRKGVTVMGLHKAIRRGQVLARPAKAHGTRLLVSARSLDHWTPNLARQAAGRRAAARSARR
jgi:hypothetical protein